MYNSIKLAVIFLFVSFGVNAASDCPGFNPPTLSPKPFAAGWSYGGYSAWDQSSEAACHASAALVMASQPSWNWQSPVIVSVSRCDLYKTETNGSSTFVGYIQITPSCPPGYSSVDSTSCGLVNPEQNSNNVVCQYQAPACEANHSIGVGGLSDGTTCVDGCSVTMKGIGVQLGESDIMGEYIQTGETCTGGSSGANVSPANSNCVTNGSKSLCIDKAKPGCGTLNGQNFCSDEILNKPGLGKCHFVGTSGYVCASGDKAPEIKGEPVPSEDFGLKIPLKDAGGSPANGGDSGQLGGSPGGSVGGVGGAYPGPSGNGTGGKGPGGGNEGEGTSKNQCETHPGSIGCMATASYWDAFKKGVKDGMTEFVGTDPGNHPALQTQAQSATYSPVGVSSSAQCPDDLTSTVFGQPIALSYGPLCQYADGISNVVLVVAGFISAYVALGMPLGGKS